MYVSKLHLSKNSPHVLLQTLMAPINHFLNFKPQSKPPSPPPYKYHSKPHHFSHKIRTHFIHLNSFSRLIDNFTATKMSGRGKGGKWLGKGEAKGHGKLLCNNIPAICLLSRKGGVKCISGLIYKETSRVLKIYNQDAIRTICKFWWVMLWWCLWILFCLILGTKSSFYLQDEILLVSNQSPSECSGH